MFMMRRVVFAAYRPAAMIGFRRISSSSSGICRDTTVNRPRLPRPSQFTIRNHPLACRYITNAVEDALLTEYALSLEDYDGEVYGGVEPMNHLFFLNVDVVTTHGRSKFL